MPSPSPSVDELSPEMIREQQEAFRALLRQSAPSPGEQDVEEDPTMKLVNALMGGMGGMPGADPSGGAGTSADAPGGLSPDLASSLGLPPFVSNMLGSVMQQPTEEQKMALMMWKIVHTVFAIAVGIYLVFITSTSVATYGSQPPPPATVQNPFLFFTTGELVLTGARVMLKSRNGGLTGPFMYIQVLKDLIRDGSIALFLFGMGAWWTKEWTIV
ncbi:hypothetical protein P175DRAFT_0504151 [Aspergillus ochraceoroseus IBT 24754]|nr:uncharacterized protein P175DRAFT_0504151 [Aspergillus ochraceoroseus IBT 24754]PTU18240.1 hypothetical protein P175DRAFT_0504151 [Aspergillus ochraceoroseus IBT 24754]